MGGVIEDASSLMTLPSRDQESTCAEVLLSPVLVPVPVPSLFSSVDGGAWKQAKESTCLNFSGLLVCCSWRYPALEKVGKKLTRSAQNCIQRK